MAEQAATHRPYDPLWNDGAPKKRRGSKLAIGLSIAAHAAVIWGIYETKFVMKQAVWGDEQIIEIETRRLPKPPPPPPEVKPDLPKPPPPPVHEPLNIREAILPPDLSSIPTYIPLPPLPPPKPTIADEAPTPQAPPPVITNPDWLSKPSADDMARYYPERAQRLEINGRATIQCQVTAKGAVAECSLLSETPDTYGFGEAALKLSKMFKMKPRLKDGQAVEGATVKIPIVFTIK